MTGRKPAFKPPRGSGIRQRQTATGLRWWWEPNATERAAGAQPVDLDPARPTWSIKRAQELRAQAAGTAPKPQPGTSWGRSVTALIEEYMRSATFARLKPATQDGYRIAFGAIERHWGHRATRSIEKHEVYAWYEGMRTGTPTYAAALVRHLSLLMSHAERLGWRAANTNPCLRMRLPSAEARHRFATWAEFDALMAAAKALDMPNMAAAIALAVFTGQRQKDIYEATVGAFVELVLDEDAAPVMIWNLLRSKRGNAGSLPLLHDAAALVPPLLGGRGTAEILLRDDRSGAPYSRDSFATAWQAVRERAAQAEPSLLDPVLQFRDLRRTFGVWSREGGADKSDVGDVLGNSVGELPQLSTIYTPGQLATALRAVQAIRRPQEKDRKKA